MFKIWGNYAGWKALELFLRNPTRRFYLREAARDAGISIISASNYLKEYAKEGILESQKKANLLEFSLNEESQMAILLKKGYALHLAREREVVERILEKSPNAQTICIYGSYANGTYDERSDFDILAISPKGEMGIKIKLSNGMEASILCMTMEGWRKADSDFKASVLKSHVILHGPELISI